MSRTIVLATLTVSLALLATAAARAAGAAGAGPSGPSGPSGRSGLSDLDRMAAEHRHDRPLASPAATTAPAQPVSAEEVTFGQVGGTPARGYFAQPTTRPGKPSGGTEAAPVPLPGIIVIHEWWGLNDNLKAMTRRLAGEGYQALAVDLFAGKVAETPDVAKQLVGSVMADRAAAFAVLRAADDFLKRQGAPRVGVVGWCFGGGWSLQAALEMPEGIDAAVVYYGQPEKDRARLERLRAPLLGLFGAADQGIPAAAVRDMESTLKQLGKSVEIHLYDGAGHAFANPSGTNYRPAAAEDAWRRTVAFFKQHLKGA
jgi:carboxymethylenebutenolidase